MLKEQDLCWTEPTKKRCWKTCGTCTMKSKKQSNMKIDNKNFYVNSKGKGVWRKPNGVLYIGNFKRARYDGFGYLSIRGMKYHGGFKGHRFHG